jgi:hypothetical protein
LLSCRGEILIPLVFDAVAEHGPGGWYCIHQDESAMTSPATGASVVAMFEILMAALGALRSTFQSRASLVAPWQNGYAERFVGTLRRELLDHLIVVSERHLLRAVRDYVAYYNSDRPHLSLGGDAPFSRPVEPPTHGKIVALPRVGGLHHRYFRAA